MHEICVLTGAEAPIPLLARRGVVRFVGPLEASLELTDRFSPDI